MSKKRRKKDASNNRIGRTFRAKFFFIESAFQCFRFNHIVIFGVVLDG